MARKKAKSIPDKTVMDYRHEDAKKTRGSFDLAMGASIFMAMMFAGCKA
jgi:hypothetical protein